MALIQAIMHRGATDKPIRVVSGGNVDGWDAVVEPAGTR
jgi:hypothetical protein